MQEIQNRQRQNSFHEINSRPYYNSNYSNNPTQYNSSNDPQPYYDNSRYSTHNQEMIQTNRAPPDLDSDLPPLPADSQNNIRRNSTTPSYHSNSSNRGPKQAPVNLIKAPRKRSKCLPCFPCIRSTCGRVTCCLCILLLLAVIILVIVVFAVFKIPTVDYLGTVGTPTFSFNMGNTTFGIDMVADLRVHNPNPIGFNFDLIDVTAFFPEYEPALGGGNVTNVNFPSRSTRHIQFPISIAYDRHQDPGFKVIRYILTRCGITGGTDNQLTINYDVKATVRVIGIKISPNIKNQSYSFDCPVNIMDIVKEIPGGISSFIGDIGAIISHVAG